MKNISIHQIIDKLSEKGINTPYVFGNRGIAEISKATKKRAAFIKIAITDEMAEQFLCFPMKATALFITLPTADVNKILEETEK